MAHYHLSGDGEKNKADNGGLKMSIIEKDAKNN